MHIDGLTLFIDAALCKLPSDITLSTVLTALKCEW